MFGIKRIKELNSKIAELEMKIKFIEEALTASQEIIEKNQRRCSAQSMAFKESLANLEKKIEIATKKEETQSPLGSTEDKKQASYSQVIDEWLNGKKEDK